MLKFLFEACQLTVNTFLYLTTNKIIGEKEASIMVYYGFYRDTLTEEFLRREYLVNLKSQRQIAYTVGCDRKLIQNYMRRFGIPRRSSAYALHIRHKKNFNLSQEIKNYIDGLLLGDGHIRQKSCWSAPYIQTFAIRYEKWTRKIQRDFKKFGIVSNTLEQTQEAKTMKKTGQQFPLSEMIKLSTKFYEEFILFRKRWYPNGFKIVPKDIELTPQLLANWHMGDGEFDTNTRRVALAVNAFSLLDVQFLINKLKEFRIESKNHPKRTQGNQPRIRLNSRNSEKFLDITEPYKVSCFDYKWGC